MQIQNYLVRVRLLFNALQSALRDELQEPNKPKSRLLLFGLALTITFIVVGFIFVLFGGFTTREWVLYIGVMFGLIGWIVTSYVSLHNSMKQHTMNVLLQSRLSAVFTEYRKKVAKVYPFYPESVKVPKEDIERFFISKNFKDNDEQERDEALEALRYLLNYYEFLAVAIKQGDLDEKLLKSCIHGIVSDLREKSGELINYIRGDDGKGNIKDPQVFKNLLDLYEKWKLSPPSD